MNRGRMTSAAMWILVIALLCAVVALRDRASTAEQRAAAAEQRAAAAERRAASAEQRAAAAEQRAAAAEQRAGTALELANDIRCEEKLEEGFAQTTHTCLECGSGDPENGGMDATHGCGWFCSKFGFCGTTEEYAKGTDCRAFGRASLRTTLQNAQIARTLLPTPASDLRAGITLAMHGDSSRLAGMLRLSQRWDGAVAMAVLVYTADDLARVERATASPKAGFRWCAFKPPLHANATETTGRLAAEWVYPINIMRNRALQLVETRQVLLIDSDFSPSDSLNRAAKTGVPDVTDDVVLIVPAFGCRSLGTNDTCLSDSTMGPLRSKQNMLAAVPREGAQRGDFVVNVYPPFMAAQVEYAKFWEATENYEARGILQHGEPYYIAATSSILSFDERFVGYGEDKVEQWTRTGCVVNKVMVSHDFFLLHTDSVHPDWRSTHHLMEKWHASNVKLYEGEIARIGDVCGLPWHKDGEWPWDDMYPSFLVQTMKETYG